ncbi:MAG: lamin tail domain-containing protein [Pirellulales bacterium]
MSRQRTFEPLEARLLLAGEVLINELMYHPGFGAVGQTGYVTEDIRQEYVELLNQGTDAVNLAGWRLTRGVEFTFPDVTIGAGQYLVVAADVAAFSAKYPDVTNVVGGWQGRLSNSGQDLELEDAAGTRIDLVSYASEGDWAQRRQGPVASGHPTWFRGWDWVSQADAGRKSLELVNTALDNNAGQNWAASLVDEGTPGRPNSVATADIAPMILDIAHLPAVPKSTDPVTVTARIVDELAGSETVSLAHRLDGAVGFTIEAMYDDGLHGDGQAGDGVFGAILAPEANNTIVEFYVQAADAGGKIRTWPGPTDDLGTQGANLLYQVDDTAYAGSQPIYRLVTPAAELTAWNSLMSSSSGSNAQMNGTLVTVDGTGTDVRYTIGIRNRGSGTRSRTPHNYRINLPNDHPFHGLTAIDLNTQYTHSQTAGNAIFLEAGLPAPYGTPIQVRTNNVNLANPTSNQFGSYFRFEPYASEFADEHFPNDPSGNIYKGVSTSSPDADLRYINENPNSYRMSYSKETNIAADDWSDLIELVRVLNTTPDDQYTQEVNRVVNVDEWLGYFAVNALVGNRENSLGGVGTTGHLVGDDYSMYRGMVDTRFQLLVHDMDTVLAQGDTAADATLGLFLTSTLPTIDRFLKWKDFAPRYFEILKTQVETTLSPARLNPLLDQLLGSWVPAATIQRMKDFAVSRNAYVLGQIPLALTVTSPLAQQDGYYRTTAATTTLSGRANAIDTRSVLVNGAAATWTGWQAAWSAADVALVPGINRIVVQALDGDGREIDRQSIDIWYDGTPLATVPGGTLGDTVWTAAGGPYHVTGNLTLPAGKTLSIEPGTTVYFDPGTNLTVRGRLVAQGSEFRRIRLTRMSGTTGKWNGVQLVDTVQDNLLDRVDIDQAEALEGSVGLANSRLVIDHMTFAGSHRRLVYTMDSSLVVRNSVFPDRFGPGEFPAAGEDNVVESIKGQGILPGGQMLIENNVFGTNMGHNDVIDFSGPDRPGPILQVLNNVFKGAGDEALDLGGDAYIEGNVFMHIHKDQYNTGTGDSNAITTGDDTTEATITVVRNVFYDIDHVVDLKTQTYMFFENNVVVGIPDDTASPDVHYSAIKFLIPGRDPEGKGAYLDGNIFWDVPQRIFEGVDQSLSGAPFTTQLEMNRTLVPPGRAADKIAARPGTIMDLGVGNLAGDPRFVDAMRDFTLRLGSPALGTGPHGLDMGAMVPAWASISGVPAAPTVETSATLSIGGPGITHYKWRLDGGAWSAETPVDVPVALADLAQGDHTLFAIGKNYAGIWQDEAAATASRTWTVVPPSGPRVRINEFLAHNVAAVAHGGAYPDLVELVNQGQAAADLADMSLSDDPSLPRKFVFPEGTVLGPGEFLVLYADADTASPGVHLGFSLEANGESLALYDSIVQGGGSIDSVAFGLQAADLSLGRLADGTWSLTQPTFGQANLPARLGDPATLKINEWLADSNILFDADFVELYNPDPLPVALGGLYLTDNPVAWPDRQQIAPLSFIAGSGYAAFTADRQAVPADHVDFALSPQQGMIGLFDADLARIDVVTYGPQTTDVSEGRSPNGAVTRAWYTLPQPGVGNPTHTVVVEEKIVPLIGIGATDLWKYNDANTDLLTAWQAKDYVEGAGWKEGAGVFYNQTQTYPEPRRTLLLDTPTTHIPFSTYYFRKHFTVNTDLSGMTLELKMILDDGAVLYLNGMEVPQIGRIRMAAPPTQINFSSHANKTVSGAAVLETFSINVDALPPGMLVQGDNVLAVEVHQPNDTSPDVTFGCWLTAKKTATTTIISDPVPERILALAAGLRITEVMYNPPGGAGHEFVEVQNTSDLPLDLAGVRLAQGIDFVFPPMQLAAGAYTVVVNGLAAFRARYGDAMPVAGEYAGSLSNGGEDLKLQLPAPYDAAVLQFHYDDVWYPATDGGGRSLVVVDPLAPAAAWRDAAGWRASLLADGSPGAPDIGDIVPPAVLATSINGGSPQRSTIASLAVRFSEDVSASLGSGDLTLREDGGAAIDLSAIVPAYDPATSTATWNLAGLALPDGNYTATLAAAGVSDAAGNPLAGGDAVIRFFRLLGDTDGNAAVDIFDVATFQINYGQPSGMSPAQGDLDGDGDVDIFDVALLQVQYGKIAGGPAAMPEPAAAPTSRTPHAPREVAVVPARRLPSATRSPLPTLATSVARHHAASSQEVGDWQATVDHVLETSYSSR